ncbi:MAG: glycosyltransferase family 2 protein [Desulfobacca sp.]|uniref:glycosyltransferase family 2 protein n=1 Tax=Desulfobacca sp. TaxID=2067990 RepID=UPI0040498235
MKISVIIVSYNTSQLLHACLTSLVEANSSHEVEIFVVDNDSRDDSVAMVRRHFPQVRLIANRQNLGFAAANNQAYQEISGNYIVLLNPDARLQPGSLDRIVDFMEAHPEVGICGGRVVNSQGQLEPSARRFPNSLFKFLIISGLSDRFAHSRFFARADYKYFDHQTPLAVDWVPGTFTILRRAMLDQIGFFDDRFFLYYEETDLCLRAKRAGWQVYFFPGAEVVHVGGACSKTRKDLQLDLGGSQLLKFRLRSELLYFRKNFGLGALLANAGVEMAFHLLRCLVNMWPGEEYQRKRQYSLAILRHCLQALRDTHWGLISPAVPW